MENQQIYNICKNKNKKRKKNIFTKTENNDRKIENYLKRQIYNI